MPYVLTEALKDRCRFRRELGHARWWMPSIDRTIALDSSFTPDYIHASSLASNSTVKGWERYAHTYLALRPSDDYATYAVLLSAVLASP